MVDFDETDLSGPKKAFRAQAHIADIDVHTYDDPDIEHLQKEVIELLDELATKLQAADDE